MDMSAVMRLMGMKKAFESRHPKFTAFVTLLLRQGVEAGTVIDITVTRPDGSALSANMKVAQEDVELVQELKTLAPQR